MADHAPLPFRGTGAYGFAIESRGRPIMLRPPQLKNFRRIVVKVGSSLLVDSDAGEVRENWLSALADDIAILHRENRDILIGSSGAIALGRSRL